MRPPCFQWNTDDKLYHMADNCVCFFSSRQRQTRTLDRRKWNVFMKTTLGAALLKVYFQASICKITQTCVCWICKTHLKKHVYTLPFCFTQTHTHRAQSVSTTAAAPCHLLHRGITVALILLWSRSQSIQWCHKAIPNTFPKHILPCHKVLHPSSRGDKA